MNDISLLDKNITHTLAHHIIIMVRILSLFGDFTMDSKLLGMDEIKMALLEQILLTIFQIIIFCLYLLVLRKVTSMFKWYLRCSTDFNKGFKVTSKFIF